MTGAESENRKKKKRTALGNKVEHPGAWIVFSGLISGLFIFMCFWYLGYVRGTIRQDAKSNLAEMGKHIAGSLNSEILSTSDVLGGLALELAWNEYGSEEELSRFLKEQAAYWNFYDLAAIDSRGISHHADGRLDTPMNRALLSQALSGGETVYDFRIEGDQDCIVFYTPLDEEARERTGFAAVAAAYAVSNWNLFMEVSIYDGQAITRVLTKNGVAVTRDRESGGPEQYNFLQSLEGAVFEDGVTFAQVKENLYQGNSQHVSYKLDGMEYYFSSEPLQINSWSLVYTVPAGIVNSAGENMTRSVLVVSACLIAGMMMIQLLFRISRSNARKALWRAAYEDEVTGGANKNKFEQDAQALLEKNRGRYVLAYTNIYQFKLLNRRFGKEEADRILKRLHQRMEDMLLDQECCGRLSADNFVLLLRERESRSVEQRLLAFTAENSLELTRSGAVCPIRLLVGLCRFEDEHVDLTQVIDRANMAMKSLRTGAESRIAVYDARMMERAELDKEMTEQLLREDITEEFYICLQPKVELATGRVVGAEALARWNSTVFGQVPPSTFIPLAERAGVVRRIDWCAFESVCRTLVRWREEGRLLIPISFNLSKAQLELPDFLAHYRQLIQAYGVPHQYLDFEFTESILYENSDVLRTAVAEIHAMGCLCSVDDFGFGYSSLGLLGQFEADTLKLDRSFFLAEAGADSRNNRIIQSVIQMARRLGMHTVAEGVEDQEHVDMLKRFGCGAVQGYVFARPMVVREFEVFADRCNEEKYDAKH